MWITDLKLPISFYMKLKREFIFCTHLEHIEISGEELKAIQSPITELLIKILKSNVKREKQDMVQVSLLFLLLDQKRTISSSSPPHPPYRFWQMLPLTLLTSDQLNLNCYLHGANTGAPGDCVE